MISLFHPGVGAAERDAASRVLERGCLSRGPEVRMFEEEFAAFVGRRHAVAVSSGTAALHLPVVAMGWSTGTRVLTSALGYIATANVLLFEGAIPVFVDVDPKTLNLSFDRIEEDACRERRLLLTHLLGIPADPCAAKRLTERARIEVIEDASHALGRHSSRFPIGTYGQATAYSFHANKILTTGGEGGMITTDDDLLNERCRSLRDQGRQSGPHWLERVPLGFSYRLTELQAAIGRVQLRKLPGMLERRREIATLYGQLLADEGFIETPAQPVGLERSWFMYYVRFPTRDCRDRAEQALSARDIETRRLLPPLPRFPAHRGFDTGHFPEAQAAHDTCLTIPLHVGMSDEDVVEVVEALRAARLPIAPVARRARA